MFKRVQWVAVVRDGSWLVAKLIHQKKTIDIEYLQEFVYTVSLTHETITKDVGEGTESKPQLKEWLRQQKIPLRKLKVAFSCRGLITRVIVVPEISKKDLERLLTEQVDQYFTLNIQDYLVDYRVLEHFMEDGQPRQRILLAAVPKPVWEPFWETCQTLGWQPKTVDLAVDSLVRVYAWTSGLPYGRQRSLKDNQRRIRSSIRRSQMFVQKFQVKLPPTLQKNLSFRQSSALKDGWTKKLIGTLPWLKSIELPKNKKKLNSNYKVVHELSSEANLGLSSSQKGLNQVLPDVVIIALNLGRAEIVVLENGIFFLYSDLEFLWHETNRADVLLPRLEEALVPIFRVLAEFSNFFAARHFGKHVDELYITGELADIPVLIELFTENLGISTSIGFPSGWKPSFIKKAKDQGQDWMKYAHLYGMALRED